MTQPSPNQPSRYLKLPFSFDLARLQQELGSILASEWVSHANTQAYERNWSCVPLRSVGGSLDHILSINHDDFQDTIILQRSPYLAQVIDRFECEKSSVRLMSLAAGGRIKPHRDNGAALEDGLTRLHVPIQTSPLVTFCIDDETVHFSAGDTWYLNASCLHGVENRSGMGRVHLMIDCVSNAWLEGVFRAAGWIARPPPKYGDANIHDGNLDEVMTQLRSMGGAAAAQLADQLQATQSTHKP